MLGQLNRSLEEESRSLMRQLEVLIQQNQDLLSRALRDKDAFHAEERELQWVYIPHYLVKYNWYNVI